MKDPNWNEFDAKIIADYERSRAAIVAQAVKKAQDEAAEEKTEEKA